MELHRARKLAAVSYGVRLHVSGEYACFTRPELKVERVSYDVMTPSAARGILEAIHWKPAIRWSIDRIHVLRPIRFQSVRRNELTRKIPEGAVRAALKHGHSDNLNLNAGDTMNRAQRASMLLRDVCYVIEAHFELTKRAGASDTPAKHLSMFKRRAAAGQCFHQPCLGNREFVANFSLLGEQDPIPASDLPEIDRNRDLGRMLYDIRFEAQITSVFFPARLKDGVLEVAELIAEGAPA